MMRKAGTLLHISSLPGDFVIGNFGESAYSFVDFLKKSGQSLWQILPLGITGFGDSPYQSFSSFAGNPYFIDPETLYMEGLVAKEELEREKSDSIRVDYGKLYKTRYAFLRRAMSRFASSDSDYVEFCVKNASWLDGFAVFMTLKGLYGNTGLENFDREIKQKNKTVLKKIWDENREEIDFWKKTQYHFFKEWNALREYASLSGVKIIGDIPIYVAADSADVWEHPELFMVDAEMRVKLAAGCPPDAFNENGQFWGNPIYDWEAMRLDDFAWWKKRFAMMAKMYDYVRIDHFRGFAAYYSIPAKEKNAKSGTWEKGPGPEFFDSVKNSLGETEIIAEDLGFIDDDVRELLVACGFPGMKILEFAFDGNADNEYLPHNYSRNSVAYTGTHDNDTFMSFYIKSDERTRRIIREYLGADSVGDISFAAVRALFSSVADSVVVPLQDYIGIADEGRMNTPSLVGGNWCWRALRSDYNESLADLISNLASLYGRK